MPLIPDMVHSFYPTFFIDGQLLRGTAADLVLVCVLLREGGKKRKRKEVERQKTALPQCTFAAASLLHGRGSIARRNVATTGVRESMDGVCRSNRTSNNNNGKAGGDEQLLREQTRGRRQPLSAASYDSRWLRHRYG
jgi:hypothetical protein